MVIAEEEVIPILKELIRINTENPPGKTIDSVNYIAKEFEACGIKYKVQEYAKGRANIIAEFGESERSIIITGHLDTVPAGDANKWKYPPFEAIENEGKIYGRGSTDMKGAVAAYISILKKLKENDVKLDKKIVFLGTSDEEIGMDGSLEAKNAGIMEGCDFVLIGEPTELKIALAEKGTLWIKIAVEGKSAHGSAPHLGVSALEGATKLIAKMKDAVPEFEHDVLGSSTLNIGKILGGTLINVVPEFCEFECDFRLVSNELREQTKQKIHAIVEHFNKTEESKAKMEIVHELPVIESKDGELFIEKLKAKTRAKGITEIIGVNYGTDGAMLIPEYNTPFVIMGPGKLDQLHVTDEYTEKQEVIDYANIIYEVLLESYS
ncbi:MAG: M20 family metallopeptidase [Candidatus Heimdallarchaeota archaeon]